MNTVIFDVVFQQAQPTLSFQFQKCLAKGSTNQKVRFIRSNVWITRNKSPRNQFIVAKGQTSM